METLSVCDGLIGVPEQSFSEVQEKTRVEFEWSYSTYRRRLELFMPTFNQLIKRMQRKINEINEGIERRRNVINGAAGNVDVDFEVGGNLGDGDIWRSD